MNPPRAARWLTTLVAVGLSITGCDRADPNRVQGYVEGEFVYVASPQPGLLQTLHVDRGAKVAAGDPLFALDNTPAQTARDEAARKLAQASATWEDLTKGKRPSEIDALSAQIEQARAAVEFSQNELARQEQLYRTKATSAEQLDRTRTLAKQDRQRVAQLEADLATARLGARADQIAAAEAHVRAQQAALERAQWDLDQTSRDAPQAGLVFDVFYRPGEWVAAGRPIVALLPPQNIKVRAFVPQPRVGSLRVGDAVRVIVDGVGQPFAGKLNFIAPRAEYTPPVIYSQENRSKLVFMIEVTFAPDVAARLHPGQPVDVLLPK